MPQPDTPSEVKVCTRACHEMPVNDRVSVALFSRRLCFFNVPPPMTLQNDTPRQSKLSSPDSQLRTVHIIQVPNEEPSKKCGQPITNHDPHHPENFSIPSIFPLTGCLLVCSHASFVQKLILVLTLFQPRTQIQLHHIHAARKHDSSKYSVGGLVESGILQVMVVERDEDGEGEKEERQVEREEARARV